MEHMHGAKVVVNWGRINDWTFNRAGRLPVQIDAVKVQRTRDIRNPIHGFPLARAGIQVAAGPGRRALGGDEPWVVTRLARKPSPSRTEGIAVLFAEEYAVEVIGVVGGGAGAATPAGSGHATAICQRRADDKDIP
jgi:hypothetical protein